MAVGTKERLIATAERLFAQRGIAGVSLREIGEAAGQRNTAAVLYHFGSKQRLIEAIVHQLMKEHEARRMMVVTEVKRPARAAELRTAIEGMVRPLVGAVHPGSYALRFIAQLLTHPIDSRSLALVQEVVVRRMAAHLRTTLPELPPTTLKRRVRFAWRFLVDTLAGYERERETRRRPSIAASQLAAELVQIIVAMMSAPAPQVPDRSVSRADRHGTSGRANLSQGHETAA